MVLHSVFQLALILSASCGNPVFDELDLDLVADFGNLVLGLDRLVVASELYAQLAIGLRGQLVLRVHFSPLLV